ncbi:MAG: hypothetical protein A2068_13590 [Ignavibacteria bacterium GWB2_35_6b]|nr:MAG: hypothetical protein A2068_13590 [Ignavibacteria bacterium GWB2_35_6b]
MNEQINSNVLEYIKKLSVAERVLIIEDIWDSIVSSNKDLPITDEQKKELDSRLEAYHKNPNEGKSWKEIRDNLEFRL